MEEIGRAIDKVGNIVFVRVGEEFVCAECSLKGACREARQVPRTVQAFDPIGVSRGSIVKIYLSPARYILAVSLLFFFPVVMLIGAYILARYNSLSENASVGIGFLGLILSFVILALANRIRAVRNYFRAKVVEIIR